MLRPMASRDRTTPRAPAVALALAGLVAGCGGSAVTRAENVLLISVDSLRLDHVGAHGRTNPNAPGESTTPAFDALAARGVRVDGARSTTSWTLPSHAALLTGLPDLLHGVVENRRRLNPELTTLAELLSAAGFGTAGFYSGPNLDPTFGFADGFDQYRYCATVGREHLDPGPASQPLDERALQPLHHRSHRDITTPELVEHARRFTRAAVDAGEPFFCFTHWWDPHYDYLPPEAYLAAWVDGDYAGPFRGVHLLEHRRPATPRDVRHLRELYDAEIRFTDDGIAELIAHLDELGALDRTLVVYTADHGEEFYEHGRWGHQRTLDEEVVRIPMALAGPGVPVGRVVDARAQIHDLYATVAELVGVAPPDYVDSQSLSALWTDAEAKGRPALLHLDVPFREIHRSALTDGRFRAELDHASGAVTIHDLTRPGRKPQPLDRERPEQRFAADALARELERIETLRAELPGGGVAVEAELSSNLVDLLNALGYVVGEDGGEDN